MYRSSTAYLFLEVAIVAYLLGYCWGHFHLRGIRKREFAFTAIGLTLFWFLVDQAALLLDLWTFPDEGTLSFRLFDLPLEEYLLFFLHTMVCLVLIRHCSADRR